ncbi:MAG: hypothetical protein AAF512_25655 [Pseudomonadota bacterium]
MKYSSWLICFFCWSAWAQIDTCRPSTSSYARFDAALGTLTIPALSIDGATTPIFSVTAHLSDPAAMRFDVVNVQSLPVALPLCPARYTSTNQQISSIIVQLDGGTPLSLVMQVELSAQPIQLTISNIRPFIPTPAHINILPSNGQGGSILPGRTGQSPLGADIYIPENYAPDTLASPVIWLFSETIDDWRDATKNEAAILVDLNEFNNIPAIANKLTETRQLLEAEYSVDMGRYYWAGWSAGGNIAIILGAANQDSLAGVMVFPGTGGNFALFDMANRTGHKMRLYYACGSNDTQFNCGNVEFEANAWQSRYGYETRYESIQGATHRIREVEFLVRANAWAWMLKFNLLN